MDVAIQAALDQIEAEHDVRVLFAVESEVAHGALNLRIAATTFAS